MCISIESIINFLTSIFPVILGTFIGAYAAFYLERNERKKTELSKRAKEGNLAILTLHQYWTEMRQFQKEVIEPIKNMDAAWLEMTATLPRGESPIQINTPALSFLFDGKDKNLLAEILLEEVRYKMVVSMINQRTTTVLEQVQPIMAANGIKVDSIVFTNDIEEMIGPALTSKVKELTTSIISHIEENLISIEQVREKLIAQLLEMLPEEEIVKVGREFNI